MTDATRFEPGQRVTATLWGEMREGTVIEHRTSVVWVKWDGRVKKSWQHPESLTVLAPQRVLLSRMYATAPPVATRGPWIRNESR